MSHAIQANVIVTYGPGNLNRDENGIVKFITFGDFIRVRVSSQCWKHAIREKFEELFCRTYHTRYLVKVLMDMFRAEGTLKEGVTEEDLAKAITLIVTGKKKPEKKNETEETGKGKKQASADGGKKTSGKDDEKTAKCDGEGNPITDQMTAYSHYEVKAVYDIIKGLDAKGIKEIAEADKCPAKIGKLINDAVKNVSIGTEIAVFGRMTTGSIGDTIPSAVKMNHPYSIDENYEESDYIAAVDNYSDNSGSGHLGTVSISANSLYRYICIEPEQVYANLARELEGRDLTPAERAEQEQALKQAAKAGVMELLECFFGIHPAGKQNSMATMPVPSAVYVNVLDDGFAETMDSVFIEPVYGSRNMPVSAGGASRMIDFITEDASKQDYAYRAFCTDSTVRRHAESVGLDRLEKEKDINMFIMSERNTMLKDIEKQVDRILGI